MIIGEAELQYIVFYKHLELHLYIMYVLVYRLCNVAPAKLVVQLSLNLELSNEGTLYMGHQSFVSFVMLKNLRATPRNRISMGFYLASVSRWLAPFYFITNTIGLIQGHFWTVISKRTYLLVHTVTLLVLCTAQAWRQSSER